MSSVLDQAAVDAALTSLSPGWSGPVGNDVGASANLAVEPSHSLPRTQPPDHAVPRSSTTTMDSP